MTVDGIEITAGFPKLQVSNLGHQNDFIYRQLLPIWKQQIWMVHSVSFVATCSNWNSLTFYYYMEPDIKKFLASILQMMSTGLLWMLINTFFGIKLGLLFLDGKITIWHIVFYLWLVSSFVVLARYISKKLKSLPKFNSPDEDDQLV